MQNEFEKQKQKHKMKKRKKTFRVFAVFQVQCRMFFFDLKIEIRCVLKIKQKI